ncbi:LamB/YcsF family protein, partial [Pseudohoeflea coraliihabitans]
REMKIERDEMANIILYQTGALKGFLDAAGLPLSHLKPHGALYGMAARQEHIAHAVADVAEIYKVPVMGLAGTLHEEIYTARGVGFLAEFFADLDYDADGGLIITRSHAAVDAERAAARTLKAVREGEIDSVDGTPVKVRAQTVCFHSDTPNALAVARALHAALGKVQAA